MTNITNLPPINDANEIAGVIIPKNHIPVLPQLTESPPEEEHLAVPVVSGWHDK